MFVIRKTFPLLRVHSETFRFINQQNKFYYKSGPNGLSFLLSQAFIFKDKIAISIQEREIHFKRGQSTNVHWFAIVVLTRFSFSSLIYNIKMFLKVYQQTL